MGSFNNRLEL